MKKTLVVTLMMTLVIGFGYYPNTAQAAAIAAELEVPYDIGESPEMPAGYNAYGDQMTPLERQVLPLYGQTTGRDKSYGHHRCPMDLYKVTDHGRLLYVMPTASGDYRLQPNSNYLVRLNTEALYQGSKKLDFTMVINYTTAVSSQYRGMLDIVVDDLTSRSMNTYFWTTVLTSDTGKSLSIVPIKKAGKYKVNRNTMSEYGYEFMFTTAAATDSDESEFAIKGGKKVKGTGAFRALSGIPPKYPY